MVLQVMLKVGFYSLSEDVHGLTKRGIVGSHHLLPRKVASSDQAEPQTFHSALFMNLIKLKGTAKLTAQGERLCLKDSKYILFEILENQTSKGRTSSCRPSKPDLAI